MTFEERARKLAIEIDVTDGCLQSIVKALKEVERDTRHACAEAVMTNKQPKIFTHGVSWIQCSDAHNLCMNARVGD